MKWLVVLDPIESLIAGTDTSIALIDTARKKGIEVEVATIEKLFFEEYAAVLATDETGGEQMRPLRDYALILMRKEPPYDMAFHYATQLLSLSGALVVNNPAALRDFNEKLIVLPFKRFMPPTLVSADPNLLAHFIEQHEQCVVKALDSFQGRSVRKLDRADEQILLAATDGGRMPVMIQKFEERVYEGDKRVIMAGKHFLGAAMRRPKQGYHANFANSDALKTELTPREQEIVDVLGAWLVKQGIHFVGLDLIGEKLTEINTTCPTGIVQISELDGRPLAEEIVDYFITLTA